MHNGDWEEDGASVKREIVFFKHWLLLVGNDGLIPHGAGEFCSEHGVHWFRVVFLIQFILRLLSTN